MVPRQEEYRTNPNAEAWRVAPGESPAAGEQAGEGDVPEVLRIERALHEFGVLNLYPRAMRDEEVEAARVDVERALDAERASTCPERWVRAEASARQAFR